MFNRTFAIFGRLFVAALAAGALVACQADHYAFKSARSSPASLDRYEFVSEVYRPLTISLIETFAARPIWSLDVPVNFALVVDLDREGEDEIAGVSGRPATKMTWYLYGPDRANPVDKGEMALQGVPVSLEMSVRPAPEYPLLYVPVGDRP